MKLNANWLVMLTVIATLGLATACGDDGCEPAAEEACQCTRQDGSVRDGFRVCDPALEEWTDCVCASRSVRFCNVLTSESTTIPGTIENIECTMEIKGSVDSFSYTASTGECDHPVGSFCRPLPPDETLAAKLTCVDGDNPTDVYRDYENIAIDLNLPSATDDYAIVLDFIDGLPLPVVVDIPAEDILDTDVTYETCEDYTVPTFDDLEALIQ